MEVPLYDEQGMARRRHLDELENQITELAAHLQAGTYRLLVLLREYDEGNGWFGEGLYSCAHWLNWRCGISIGAAREKVRVAHALKDLPQISAAFEKGTISYSKVRAMTRVATPENEDQLLDFAHCTTASHVERLVRTYRKVKRVEAIEKGERKHHERRLRWYVDDDGTWVMYARLAPEQGAIIAKALQAAMDDVPAEISAEIYRDTETQREPAYPANAKRADALEKLAESYLAGKKEALSGGDKYLIEVHTTVDTLTEDGDTAESHLERGEISAETSRRLACDASLIEITEDEHGIPLDVGRKTRTIPPAIRRALKNRDGGCRFPGCCNDRYVDAHHIHHWADGGDTNMDNLVLVCRYHHGLVHEGGFGIVKDPAGTIQFTNPKGKIIPPTADQKSRGNFREVVDYNVRTSLGIGPNTSTPWWYGEKIDYNMPIQSMLYRDQRNPPT